MNRSLTRCQVVAFVAGVLLCAVGMGIMILLHWLGGRSFYLGDGGKIAGLSLAMLILPTVVTCLVAIYSWPHWRVALIPALVPAIAVFLAGYTFDIRTLIESVARHEATGGMLGYTSPLNLFGQAGKALPLLGWVVLISALGLYLKRLFVGKELLDSEESEGFFTPFLLALVVLIVCGLITYSVVLTFQNTPGARVASARKIMLSPRSAEFERSRALLDIWRLRGDGATEVLRMAATNQPPPINILAASFLADRNDISALPLLESHLILSGTLKGQHFEWNIGNSLRRIKDPKAIPALIRLLNSPEPETRQSAIQALRTIGGDAVVDPLIAGLSDADQKVRWISVMGLAETVGDKSGGKEGCPDFNEFQAGEKLYLDHWKEWAFRHNGH